MYGSYKQLLRYQERNRVIRIAKYARCSSDEQKKNGYTIGDQISLMDEFCEEYELAVKAKQGDIIARDKILKANLRFVVSVAKKYQCSAFELNDLINELKTLEYITINSSENSSPYILTISAVGLRGEVVMHALEEQNVIVGNGSACSSKNRFSRVIEACGYKNDVLDGVVRISFSPNSTFEEVNMATNIINETAKKLKGILK